MIVIIITYNDFDDHRYLCNDVTLSIMSKMELLFENFTYYTSICEVIVL